MERHARTWIDGRMPTALELIHWMAGASRDNLRGAYITFSRNVG